MNELIQYKKSIAKYKRNHQMGIWGAARISFDECVNMTIDSIKKVEGLYKYWAIAWSGGKDSTALITVIITLINSGQIKQPEKMKIFLADTRMELVPLWYSAMKVKAKLESMGIDVEVVVGEIDNRFWVYMLGYGVPPPSNTFRWCTPKLKIDPIEKSMKDWGAELNEGQPESEWEKILLLTGVRIGESATRDARINVSCSKDGSECGQGHYHTISKGWIDTLAPIVHWRVCVIWDWLKIYAPMHQYGSWPTEILADAYGGEEAEEINARTGCIACNLASKDLALLTIIQSPQWAYLKPLLNIRELYKFLKLPAQRLRKTGYQQTEGGKGVKNQGRMGPLTFEARREGLTRLLNIIDKVNHEAVRLSRPLIDIINEQEIERIHQHWIKRSWPQGWDGTEQRADQPFIQFFTDGSSQPNLFN
jgi:DNA sulfur modification protein DndC